MVGKNSIKSYPPFNWVPFQYFFESRYILLITKKNEDRFEIGVPLCDPCLPITAMNGEYGFCGVYFFHLQLFLIV